MYFPSQLDLDPIPDIYWKALPVGIDPILGAGIVGAAPVPEES